MGRAHDLAATLMPPVGRLRAQRDRLAAERDRLAAELNDARASVGQYPALYPPGHFHSPLPDLADVRRREQFIFRIPESLPGIDLRTDQQLELLRSLSEARPNWPYYDARASGLRYRPDNDYFGHVDGLFLFGLLNAVRPKRYVEVGSGWSSALVLDVRDRWLPELEATFIEPFPERLLSLLRHGDRSATTIVRRPVQEVDPATFEVLEPGDVLFIDSTHVSKIGSDVNHLFFEVFPRLAPGVWVHVHDIRYPFEYSAEWVYEGRAWNEAYVLRALLTESPAWQIELWASCLQLLRPDDLVPLLPEQATLNGASIWLRHR